MKVIQGKSPIGWRDWLLEFGTELVAREQDVRVFIWEKSNCLGSVLRIPPDGRHMIILPYCASKRPITIPVDEITRIEVFQSHRCSPSEPQEQRMRDMRQVEFPPIPIDDTCP
ncbi:MAG TPA: hypothetical protein DIS62_01550 [Candidatus Kerfeldbacteria bacterium]|nr:hypothetical protein [Candidatus Kerfeldbacteria bacterium]